MSKNKLIAVHGMGQHTEESFKKEIVDSLKSAFQLYPSLQDKDPEAYTDIISVGYNGIFDAYREKVSDRGKTIEERLKSIDGMSDDLISKAVKKIASIETEIGEDELFNTHWLDVLLYRYTTLGEQVRIKVGTSIAEALSYVNGGGKNVHILGHSLGTAVVHDTLAKLYEDKFSLKDIKNLNVTSHKLGSVHMVANTSRVLESFVNVSRSLVKPGGGGCTRFYREYRHALDPITWAKSFNPTDNGGWISNDSWYLNRYRLARPTSLTNEHGNVHSIQHYLENPKVHLEIFSKVLDIKLTKEQIQEGHYNYIDSSLEGKANDLEETVSDLKKLDLENVQGLIKSAIALKDFVKKLGGEYK
jgi:hypothetical protein